MIKRLCAMLVCIATLSACSWVELNPEAQAVQVADISDVGGCTSLGTINAQVIYEVVSIDRSRDDQARELAILARNEAAKMGATTVVATSEIHQGRQEFAAYRCE